MLIKNKLLIEYMLTFWGTKIVFTMGILLCLSNMLVEQEAQNLFCLFMTPFIMLILSPMCILDRGFSVNKCCETNMSRISLLAFPNTKAGLLTDIHCTLPFSLPS